MIKKRSWIPVLVVVAAVAAALVYSDSIRGLLRAIPAVGWAAAFGAVVAAVISLAGVVASNYSSMTRLREQHQFDREENIAQRQHDADEAGRVRDHEAAQSTQNRKAEIRRAVYIEAIEATLMTLSYIGSLFARPPSSDGSDEQASLSFLKASAKIWLVAETDAALHARELAALMTEASTSAQIRAAPLRQSLAAIRSIEERIARAEAEVRRIETKIAETSEQLRPPTELEAVQNSWKVANQWLETLRQTLARMHADRTPQILTYIRVTMAELKPVQEGLVKLVSQLRTEIHLGGNHEEFAAQLVTIERRMRNIFNKAFGFGPEHPDRF